MLDARGLRKVYRSAKRGRLPTLALDDVDLTVPGGVVTSVLGPSGSGKTTLLRCIAGFERPDAGTISIHGQEIVSSRRFVRPSERRIGVVPQEGALFPHLTVAGNVGFGLVGVTRQERAKRVAEMLELVGLDGLGQRRPDQLSGGQQQRVAVARALAPGPELILLDEPFSALDARLRVDLREEICALLRGLGTTVVLVTHDQSEALSLSDRLVVMQHGRISAAGTPREVYDHPADADLARFLGDALIMDGVVGPATGPDQTVRVSCALGDLPITPDRGEHGPRQPGRCLVLVRPEQLAVSSIGDGSAAGSNHQRAGTAGTVVSHSYFGHDALLAVAVPDLPEPVAVRIPGSLALAVGDAVLVSVTEPVATYEAREPDPT